MPVFKKYYFYTLIVYLMLRGVCAVIWTTIVYFHEIGYLDIWAVNIAICEVLIVITGIIIFTFYGGRCSTQFFDNVKFRNRGSYNSYATVTFAFLFLIMLIVQSAAAINMIILIPRAAIDFKKAFKNYGYECEETTFIDDIQDGLYCCGIHSYRDYQELLDVPIPGSCCDNSWGCTADDVGFRSGCAFRLKTSRLIYQVYLMSIFALTFNVAVLVGSIFLLYLAYSTRKRNIIERQETYHIRGE